MSDLPTLSKSQLAAIDFLIAHMQEKDQTELGSFIDGIVNGFTHAVDNILHGVVATKLAIDIPACEAAALDGQAGTEFKALINKVAIESEEKLNGLSLSDLTQIRSAYEQQ